MPVHTVYVGAHAFDAATPRRLASAAREFYAAALSDASRVGEVFDLDPELAAEVERRVAARFESLRLESPAPGRVIEDLRVDFEDGYAGHDEAADARRAAVAAADADRAGELPAGFGLRIHSMGEATRSRSLRALDLFTCGLLESLGELPAGLVVTLAKIDSADEVTRLADALDAREASWGLASGRLRIELMAETPRSIYDAEGRLAVPFLVRAARGRCVGVHFGIYDYTASLGLGAAQQRLRHPACDVARCALQIGLAGLRHEGLGVELSDGSSRVVPRLDMPDEVLRQAMRGVFDDIVHALDRGIYRGWDMAPSHVALRWLAVTAFYLQHLPELRRRWDDATSNASPSATPRGETVEVEDLEDTATRAALRTFFRRGLDCGVLLDGDLPAGLAGTNHQDETRIP